MAKVLGLQCVRCGTRYSADRFASACSSCAPAVNSNLTVVYDESLRVPRPKPGHDAGRGLWRYGSVLPVEEDQGVSLGEGFSPLHHLKSVGAESGLRNLFVKDETRNPTWSFKDRLACLAVSSAKQFGAEVIVSSSSGNAGAAAAAYAAKAKMPCVIFTFKGTTGPMLTQMRSYGAEVVMVEEKPDRWRFMEYAVKKFGWFPTSPFFGPVIGSNPFGIEGYKTLAYEIVEQLGWRVPDWCILPVCYGDALVGMWRGFEDMVAFGWTDKMPRMVAAEVYGSLTTAISQNADAPPEMPKPFDTVAVSIGALQGTYQALDIVRRSHGVAIQVSNDDMMRWQSTLASEEGLYVEPSSAAGLVAVEKLSKATKLGTDDLVVSLLTASGLKDPGATAKNQGEPIVVPSQLETATRILTTAGVFPGS